MNTTYFAFLSALMRAIGDNVATFFAGESDFMSHFRIYQNTFETYATGFGPFGWTLYGFSLLLLVGLLLSLGLFVTYLIQRLPYSKKAVTVSAMAKGASQEVTPATRFPKLCALDDLFALNPPLPLIEEENLSLEKICNDFREYCAHDWGLYYEIGLIRCFVSALASTKLLLLEGVSGTGKTSLPCRFADFIGGKADVVPVEPSWREKTELLGYYNDFNHEYHHTPFLESLYHALYENGIHFIVLDEVNLSRIEYYFAEFLSVLELPEEDKRVIPLIGKVESGDPKKFHDGSLPLGKNVYFIGTANHDESTFAITDKVYDRAMSLPFSPQRQTFEAEAKHPIYVSHAKMMDLFSQAREERPLQEDCMAKLESLFAYLEKEIGLVVGNRIRAQMQRFLPVYQACGGSETEAIDSLLVSKVLRKFEGMGSSKIEKIPLILSQIEALFGKDALPMSIEFLQKRSN